jgi:hypothetical protein
VPNRREKGLQEDQAKKDGSDEYKRREELGRSSKNVEKSV